MDGINHLSKSTAETTSAKQKRQLAWSPIRRRKKQSRSSYNYYDNEDDDSDESESEEDSDHDTHYTHNRDRLENTNDQPYPFWDTYDTLNQYYLEVGKRTKKKPIE